MLRRGGGTVEHARLAWGVAGADLSREKISLAVVGVRKKSIIGRWLLNEHNIGYKVAK
jgi:hypothetical protein